MAHKIIVDWIVDQLLQANWDTGVQEGSILGHDIRNIIAKRDSVGAPWIIIGCHFDTRLVSDRDVNLYKRATPVPGANDGASGVSVLLELGRVIPKDLEKRIWLVFFDAEDNGRVPGWDSLLGSQYFVQELDGKPDAVVILDMVGDSDLNIYYEQSSDIELSEDIWSHAIELGYGEIFFPMPKFHIIDDHTPFLMEEISAIDIIDFDYPYWHTTEDTVDKVSAESLEVVGQTVLSWLKSH
jgi:Zn-dependent M28 family amino/carboxypeptidase